MNAEALSWLLGTECVKQYVRKLKNDRTKRSSRGKTVATFGGGSLRELTKKNILC